MVQERKEIGIKPITTSLGQRQICCRRGVVKESREGGGFKNFCEKYYLGRFVSLPSGMWRGDSCCNISKYFWGFLARLPTLTVSSINKLNFFHSKQNPKSFASLFSSPTTIHSSPIVYNCRHVCSFSRDKEKMFFFELPCTEVFGN